MPVTFDVVTVPDFRSCRVVDFETRTLFFLASWIECGAAVRGTPLHVACIGDPPPSVRRLAADASASVTVHQPLDVEGRGTSNKIRGLETNGRSDQVLLVDTDVLFLREPGVFGELGPGLAAAPAVAPRVPDRYWERVYGAFALAPPEERIESVRGALDCPIVKREMYPGQKDEVRYMRPYFGAGVVWAPRDRGLGPLWLDAIRRTVPLVAEGEAARASVTESDQVGLAVAIEMLRRRGVPFRTLPPSHHAHWLHFYRRTASFAEARLFHAFRFAEKKRNDGPGAAVRRYAAILYAGMLAEAWRQDVRRRRLGPPLRDLPGALADAKNLAIWMGRLARRVTRVLPS